MNERVEVWDFKYDLVEEFYVYIAERWQVDPGDEVLEVFARTVKIEQREGEETCLSHRGWL